MIDQLPETVLSLGDLVGLSFRKFRQNFGLYWSALIVPAMGAALGSNSAYFCFYHWVGVAAKSMLALGPFAGHMMLVLLGIVIWCFSVWELMLRSSAIIRLILGLEKDYTLAYQWVKGRSGAIFLAYNLFLLPPLMSLLVWTFVAFLFVSLIPQAQPLRMIVSSFGFGLIGFGLTVSVALASLFGALSLAIIACEALPLAVCLKRAYYFFRERLLRGGSFICLMSVALLLVYVACFSPIFLMAIIENYTHADLGLASRSVYVQFVEAILDTSFNIVSFGIGFTGYGLFYRDLRLRLEGQDLLSKIDNLGLG